MPFESEESYLEYLTIALVSIKEDEKLCEQIIRFCEMPHETRKLHLEQLSSMNLLDEQSPYQNVFKSLSEDAIAEFALKYLKNL